MTALADIPAPTADAAWRDLLAAADDVHTHTTCHSDNCGWHCTVPTEYLDALQSAVAVVTGCQP